MRAFRPALVPLLLLLPGSLLGACRDAGTGGGAAATSLPPSTFGSNGCAGAEQTLAVGQTFTTIGLSTLSLGPFSQVCAARDIEVLYATGANATLVSLDFSAGSPPIETLLVTPGTLDTLLSAAGIAAPASLSGLCVLDESYLLVMEHTSHVILSVHRSAPDLVAIVAGLPSAVGGFADGLDFLARFNFIVPSQIGSSSDGRVFVADPGNHALRVLQGGLVSTLAGTGAPLYADGDLFATFFDTPTGLVVDCADHLIVSERGDSGQGGQRLRQLSIGPATFFGQQGTSTTLYGNGLVASVEGIGAAASLAGPVAPVVSAGGEMYWIDSATGVLRRSLSPSSVADCPLGLDCAAAVAGPSFTTGTTLSLALTEGGILYALDAGASALYRITPP